MILLFAISVTGLALTVSQEWLRGTAYSFLAIIHAITVIAGVALPALWKVLPHFSAARPVGREALSEDGRRRARARFARAASSGSLPRCTSADLKTVLPQLGFDYTMPGTDVRMAGSVPAVQAKDAFAVATQIEIRRTRGHANG